jgi:hypothetical protein
VSHVDTYPCPACGGVADASRGCRACGRPHDPVAAALSRINQAVAGLDEQTARLTEDQHRLSDRRAALDARRAELTTALAARLAAERAGGRPRQRSAGTGAAGSARESTGTGTTGRPDPARPGAAKPDAAETSPRSAQNTLLALGAILLGIAAVVFASLFYATTATAGRAAVLGTATALALGVPVLLARRTLTATADTIAAVGLLLVLLDGYVAYQGNVAGVHAVAAPLYAALLFATVAAISVGYRFVTHLRSPQFAALLASQPLLPMLGVWAGAGRDALAVLLAALAAQNVAAARLLGGARGGSADSSTGPRPRGGPTGPRPRGGWARLLPELAWLLFGAALAGSVGIAVAGVIRADTVGAALRAGVGLCLAAAVAVTAGVLAGTDRLRHIATGAATLAVLAIVTKVDVLAIPDYTLILTAALAVGTAVATTLLPPDVRTGPRLGSLVAAGLAGAYVVVAALREAGATIRAANTPHAWAADLLAYPHRVHTTSWQVPAAAVLLAAVAAIAVPERWRGDAVAIGVVLAVAAAPSHGDLPWWAPPLLGTAASAATIGSGLVARHLSGALIRAGCAGALSFYAVTTSLARPGLTAATCALVALASGTVAAVTAASPDRFGPYADRVADLAGGAAAFTVPVAIATGGALTRADPAILLPMTTLAAALGVIGAALAQTASPTPRTGSATGALAAAVGCMILHLRVSGSTPVDVGLAAALLLAAAATATARAVTVPMPSRPQLVLDGMALGAALATVVSIVELARLLAVAVPGVVLVTTTAMVLLISLLVRALPAAWRTGARLGAGALGGVIGLGIAGVATVEAARAVTAVLPWWSSATARFAAVVGRDTPFGAQVPASLLLAAAAAWVLLPAPAGAEIGFVALALAGLAAPATLGLAWWSPMLIAGVLAVAAAMRAALAAGPSAVRRPLAASGVLLLYAVAVSGATPAATTAVLAGTVVAAALVAATARMRMVTLPMVAPAAIAVALAAAVGTGACAALASGASRTGAVAAAVATATLGIGVLVALRADGGLRSRYPAVSVALSAVVPALAMLPSPHRGQIWLAAAALVATGAAATLRPRRRDVSVLIGVIAVPTALIAAVGCAPAWFTALIGPYRTLRQVWQGYAVAPQPTGATTAVATLSLLVVVAAAVALTTGGRGYVFAAVLPPAAALVLVLPSATGAPRGLTSWVALAVALVTGLGAALSPPDRPSSARLVRGTAGIVCALCGGAGLAGSLATRQATFTALWTIVAAGVLCAVLGRDPAVRVVSWVVVSAGALSLPVLSRVAAGEPVSASVFEVLGVSAALTVCGWVLSRKPDHRAEAVAVDWGVGAGIAVSVAVSAASPPLLASVLMIAGVLVGAGAPRPDRAPARRIWLARAAIGAELGACWLLLYSARVGLPEAYTLPFAAGALLAGAWELRRRPELSSWVAYGPALAGGFLPSLGLILAGQDVIWRWASLFAAAIATVLVGAWRRRRAPVVAGAATVIAVAVTEMVRLLLRGAIAGAILVAAAGVILIVAGALAEQRVRGALRTMS